LMSPIYCTHVQLLSADSSAGWVGFDSACN
jgi:hypothetical protein